MSEPNWVALGSRGGIVDWEGSWSAGTAYVPGDVVRHNGIDYIAVNPSTGQDPGAAAPASVITVRLMQGGPQTIPNITWTALTWSVVHENWNGEWNAGLPTRVTIKVPGIYLIIGGLAYAVSAVGAQRRLRVRISGSAIIADNGVPTAAAGLDHRVFLSTTWRLAVGDYVELQSYNDAGAAGLATATDATQLSVTRLGG